jgi:hypothetical protein
MDRASKASFTAHDLLAFFLSRVISPREGLEGAHLEVPMKGGECPQSISSELC